jgi:hypothetical protein
MCSMLTAAAPLSGDLPTWLSSAGVAALVSGVFLVIGTWINGSRQRLHEEKIRQQQLEHELRIERDKDARALRDRRYERVRGELRLMGQAAQFVLLYSSSDVAELRDKWEQSIARTDLMLDLADEGLVDDLHALLTEAISPTERVARAKAIFAKIRQMLEEIERPIG